ncbi:MAG: UvrD-helicase domain-containing protein [Treponema sp.]|nr:UvrD-helicase domain-containing protein [Treponema sp.]
MKLNDEQSYAVKTTEGYVRVLAGAGSGKTRALISRYCYLVRDAGVSPENILCVTFTNRAANEMKLRVRRELGDMDLGYICTFHAFCTLVLHEDANRLNFPKDFVILDKQDWRDIMLRIFADMNLTLKETTVQQKIDSVLEGKKLQADTYVDYIYKLNNEELKAKWTNPEKPLDTNQEIFLRFLYEQKKCFGLDFNDLINFALYLLENFSDVREKWQERMQYVMVDEFQDVSGKQYRIAQILSARHKNLFIVGDPDQTIYSWRGSHVRMILDFDKKYPTAKTLLLRKNYRSTPEILRASNTLISHNSERYPKDLMAQNPPGKKPLYFHASGDAEEAAWICGKIRELTGEGEDGKKISLHDIAILYRAHYQSRVLEETFVKSDLPYRILAGTEFYGRKEIKDSIAYLRMLTAADDNSFFRTINVPSRKIGMTKQKFIRDYAESHGVSAYEALRQNLEDPLFKKSKASSYVEAVESVRELLHKSEDAESDEFQSVKLDDVFQAILDRSGYEAFLRLEADQERLDNLAELKRSVNEAGLDDDMTLELFLQHLALFTDLDREDSSDAVKMLTIHAAKGMEFPYVFVCGMNEGVFPGRKVQTPEDMEEERRIAYVAFTRAKKGLFLSDAEGKANDGIFKYPSRFIFDAGMENLELENKLDDELLSQTKKIITYDETRLKNMKTLFKAGDEILHPVFGKGKIILVNTNASCYTIKFDGMETERSILFTAKLEKC